MRNGRCDNVVVEFGRKVFIVNYKKNIKCCEKKHNGRAQAFSCTRNHSRKHNCDEVSKWLHSVGSSSYPCQSRYDVGTGLSIMAY